MLANIQGCTLSVIAAEARVRERLGKENEANNSLIRRVCAVLERDSRKSQLCSFRCRIQPWSGLISCQHAASWHDGNGTQEKIKNTRRSTRVNRRTGHSL